MDMPKLTVDGVGTFDVPHDKRLVLALTDEASVDQLHACGGNARCTTCRVEFVAGDFFATTIPAVADAIILKSVIHDWDDARSTSILRNCRQALPSNGTLLLVERIMPEAPITTDEDRAHAMSDLNMLRGPGGRERTKQEYRDLLNESGFDLKSTYPAGRFNVIEARVGGKPPPG